VNRKPTAQTTNLPRGRRGHANHANGAYPSLAASRLGVNRLFGSGFEPQRTQSFTEMNRKPTAQTTNLPRGRRGHANGFPVGPGADRADRAGTDLCGLCGSVRDGLFGSGFFVAAPGGRGAFDRARSASAPTAGRRKHQIIGLTPFPIATSTRWPTGSESVGPGVDRAGFEPQRTQRFAKESMSLAKLAKPKAWSAKGAKFTSPCALRGSVRDGLFGSGFEPQRAQRDTELQIRVYPSRPRRESGSVVDSSGGSDRTHFDDRNATMPGLTPLG